MSSDPPTDPGLRTSPTPEATPQANEHIGTHDELILPDVVPIIHPEHAGWFLKWINEQWVQWHYFSRGVAGTAVEWYLFFVGVGEHNKKLSIILLLFLAVTIEEKYSDQPFFTNGVKYLMHAVDPEAAEIIFAEKVVEPDPIGKAAAQATEEATKAFMESAEYRLLKDDIEADVNRQIRRQAYASAGMDEDVQLIDEEIAASREERRQKRAAHETTTTDRTQPRESSTHEQGSSISPREDAPPEDATSPEEDAPEPPEEQPAEDKAKRGKGDGKASKAERLLKDVESLLPP